MCRPAVRAAQGVRSSDEAGLRGSAFCRISAKYSFSAQLFSLQYPELKSMQSMIDSIIAVSKTAHEMKLVVKQWC